MNARVNINTKHKGQSLQLLSLSSLSFSQTPNLIIRQVDPHYKVRETILKYLNTRQAATLSIHTYVYLNTAWKSNVNGWEMLTHMKH